MPIHILHDVVEYLLPPTCLACGREQWSPRSAPGGPARVPAVDEQVVVPLPSPRMVLCGTCRAALERGREEAVPGLLGRFPLLCAWEYRYPLNRLIPLAKSRHLPAVFDLLADGLARQLVAAGLARYGVAVVPVPLHPARRRERGYDQAVRLARRLARRLDLDCHPAALRRTRPTPASKRADRGGRARGVEGAFAPGRQASRVGGCRVLLVDDVITTGATLYQASLALQAADPSGILVLAAARTPRRVPSGLDPGTGSAGLRPTVPAPPG